VQTADKYIRAKVEATLTKHGIRQFDGDTVHAYVNHGRWVADCPCNGAELVAPGELMVCGSCGARNEVKFPANIDGIEGALEMRPPTNQNWHGESVESLVAENIDHGLLPEDLRKVL